MPWAVIEVCDNGKYVQLSWQGAGSLLGSVNGSATLSLHVSLYVLHPGPVAQHHLVTLGTVASTGADMVPEPNRACHTELSKPGIEQNAQVAAELCALSVN